MARINKISGFPEWLPEQKLIENRVIARVRSVYESYGFTPIETPAVEFLTTLSSKGVVDKEIYAVKRLQGESEEGELGLHFDLTVPLARYVAQHSHALVFPFKRYQLQKVWRGDRPQKGRFREFYQFDIDIIGRDDLPMAADAEVLAVTDRAILSMELGPHVIRINNRKILQGFYAGLGLSAEATKSAIISVDKIDKIGPAGVKAELAKIEGVNNEVADRIVASTALKFPSSEIASQISELNIRNEELDAGAAELTAIMNLVPESTRARCLVDFSLARGLAYYTGIICEVGLTNYPDFGTIASGGRYDNLASQFTDQKLPGVGVSIGLTRLMDLVFSHQIIPTAAKAPSEVVVTVYAESDRQKCNEIADELRDAGVPTEVYLKSPKLGKQIEYAETKGARYVLFFDTGSGVIKVKDLLTKDQQEVTSLREWAASRKAQ